MKWCNTCATFRSDPCPVCRLRRRLEKANDENVRAYRALPWEERIKRREVEPPERTQYPIKGDDHEKEAWLVQELTRELERVRKDTARMRKARNVKR